MGAQTQILSHLKFTWDNDAQLTSLATGGLHRGEVTEGAEPPYVSIRQSEGGSRDRNTGKTTIETINYRFEGIAFSSELAEQIAERIMAVFDPCEIEVGGQHAIEFERESPEFLDEIDTSVWYFSVDYRVTFNRTLFR